MYCRLSFGGIVLPLELSKFAIFLVDVSGDVVANVLGGDRSTLEVMNRSNRQASRLSVPWEPSHWLSSTCFQCFASCSSESTQIGPGRSFGLQLQFRAGVS